MPAIPTRRYPSALLFLSAALALAGTRASAASITISQVSSEGEEGGTPFGVLDATLDFSVSGTTLTLTVENETGSGTCGSPPVPCRYSLSLVAFNGSSAVSVLSLSSVSIDDGVEVRDVKTLWSLTTAKKVAGFGTFDYVLSNGQGRDDPGQIQPGEVATFTFLVNAGLSDSDFLELPGDCDYDAGGEPPGDCETYTQKLLQVAAKFVDGPAAFDSPLGDDSAFGAGAASGDPGGGGFEAPEPGSFVLGGTACLALLGWLRRHART